MNTGKLPNSFYVEIPEQRLKEIADLSKIYEGKYVIEVPVLEGVELVAETNQELL